MVPTDSRASKIFLPALWIEARPYFALLRSFEAVAHSSITVKYL